jgi:N-methylhydantoinase A/oxoprolinase/acetone carboxylase beta subunit
LAEYREYERLSTAVVNASVAPRMASHLGKLEQTLPTRRLRVMQSDGNAISGRTARLEPVRTILSGPAAGVIGASALAREFGIERFITFDMGGTSTDVSLFDRGVRIRTLTYPQGYAVRTPVVDIHTVGAGGGSIAAVDAGGSLKVGPQSAGADPGPACYGRGIKPTVTDADLVAGRLAPEHFLGGRIRLDVARAERAVASLGRQMRAGSKAAALGVIRVVNANMERAIRLITVERGFDPREFALLAFGGAGPMHACELARDLGIRHVILPRNPGLLCAYGALCARVGREYSLTLRLIQPTFAALMIRAKQMIAQARKELSAEGAKPAETRIELAADCRYRGQSYELEVALSPRFVREFHKAHEQRFGYSAQATPVEVVNLRLRASAVEFEPHSIRIARTRSKPPVLEERAVWTVEGSHRVPVYSREEFGAGFRMRGPALIVELSSTAYLAQGFKLRVDDFGNLHLEDSR